MANGQTNISGGKTLVGTAKPSDVRMGMTYPDGKELRNGTLNLENLKSKNIRSGVNIGGVWGSLADFEDFRNITLHIDSTGNNVGLRKIVSEQNCKLGWTMCFLNILTPFRKMYICPKLIITINNVKNFVPGKEYRLIMFSGHVISGFEKRFYYSGGTTLTFEHVVDRADMGYPTNSSGLRFTLIQEGYENNENARFDCEIHLYFGTRYEIESSNIEKFDNHIKILSY